MGIFLSFHKLLRAAFRNKSLTLINITGLSIGLAVAMFLLVYLHFEFSFDKHFKDAERIYRVLSVWEEEKDVTNYPICFEDLAGELRKNVPEVEMVSRLYSWGGMSLQYENKEKVEVKTYLVDSVFTQIFSFTPVYGNLTHALDAIHKCVITRTTAERFFGPGINPVGKSLRYEEGKTDLEVAAVIEDVPENTHFKFDLLTKLPDFGWGGLEYYTYLKFRPGVDHQAAMAKCNDVNKKMLDIRFTSQFEAKFGSIVEPLTSIHTSDVAGFDLKPKANKSNLIFIILITIFILAIAVCNFISLYIIQGEKRAIEISVQKTNGANRSGVVSMLFGETFLVTLMAFLISVILYYSFAGTFSSLINFNMPANISITPLMWGYFILLFLLTSLVAGGYPAYYLSRFSPTDLIRKAVVRKYRLTAVSVVVQFSVVIFCVSAMLVVWKQLDYVKNLPLGFNEKNVLSAIVVSHTKEYAGLRADLLQYPEIKEVAVSQGHPVSRFSGQGICRQGQSAKESLTVNERRTGPRYFELFDIPILQGRSFSDDMATEKQNLILSETTVKDLGLDDPVGQKVMFVGDEPYTVIGVAKDVHCSAHKKSIRLTYSAYADQFRTLSVRFEAGKLTEAKEHLLAVIEEHYPGYPATVQLIRDMVENQYWEDEVTFRILMSGTILTIALALLGLLALSGFVAQQKRKEIGVRRAMGAQVGEIMYHLNGYILFRILPAVPVGIGLSYYAMTRWLDNFENSIVLAWWIFGEALLLTLTIVLLAIMYQCLRAATANPVDALKSE